MERPVTITRIAHEDFYSGLAEMDKRKRRNLIDPQIPLHLLTKYIADRNITPAETAVPECVTCGVCCVYLLFVPVTDDDTAKLSEYTELTLDGVVPEIVVDRVLRRNNDTLACTHLGGTPGESVGCTIYNDRPQVCHDFEPGSERCHAYRRIYGLDAPLDDETVSQATARLTASTRTDRIIDTRIVDVGRVVGIEVGDDGVSRARSSIKLKIFGFTGDDETHDLHTFDPENESWLECDLLGLSLAEAAALIAAKSTKG